MCADIELLDSEHQKRQQRPVVLADKGPMLRWTGDRSAPSEKGPFVILQDVDGGEHLRLRENGKHLLDHALTAYVGGEPVVNHRDPSPTQRGAASSGNRCFQGA